MMDIFGLIDISSIFGCKTLEIIEKQIGCGNFFFSDHLVTGTKMPRYAVGNV
jgi:hypothetical protein